MNALLLEEFACALPGLGRTSEDSEWKAAVEGLEGKEETAADYVRAFAQAAAGRDREALAFLRPLLRREPGRHEQVRQEAVFRRLRERALLDAAKAKSEYESKAFPLFW